MQLTSRLDDAEAWYTKALIAVRADGAQALEASLLSNIAGLLESRGDRLADARDYAEQALTIIRALDPAANEIWKTYQILAAIAGKQRDHQTARAYRQEMRASYAAAPVGQETLRRHGNLVKGVVAAMFDPSRRLALEQSLEARVDRGWTALVEVLHRILDGERDEDALCEPLDREDSVIVQSVLRGIADPESLKEIPSAEPAVGDGQATDLSQRLEKHLPLIRAVVAAAGEPELRPQLDPGLQQMEQHGWGNLVACVRSIFGGGRSADALLGGLDEEDTLIVRTILAGIENPEALRDLLDPSSAAQPGA